MYQPNASISFYYICEQAEVFDRIWNAFKDGGNILMPDAKYPWGERYGWITDQYGKAEEAISHYSTIFKNVEVEGILRFGANEHPDEEGKVKHAQIAVDGQKLLFMDSAAPHKFTFSEGVSLTVYCQTQEEIDHY